MVCSKLIFKQNNKVLQFCFILGELYSLILEINMQKGWLKIIIIRFIELFKN